MDSWTQSGKKHKKRAKEVESMEYESSECHLGYDDYLFDMLRKKSVEKETNAYQLPWSRRGTEWSRKVQNERKESNPGGKNEERFKRKWFGSGAVAEALRLPPSGAFPLSRNQGQSYRDFSWRDDDGFGGAVTPTDGVTTSDHTPLLPSYQCASFLR